MKTKEEILKKQVFKLSNLGGFEIEALEAMQEYADQQTEQLKKEVEEKDKELSELKAKHELYTLGIINRLRVIKEWLEPNPVIDIGASKKAIERAEQYYTQTHGQ